jgi:hypothetical protein
VALPAGATVPFPEFATAFAEATADCASVKTLSASINLSGRTGATKISARIDAGFRAPAEVRLEGYPRISFGGKPFFVLVSSGAGTTLVMPRDGRVLRGAPPGSIVEALAGVALSPADLRAVAAGCGLESGSPVSGRSYPNGWAALDAGDTSVFVRQQAGRWRVAGATRGGLTVTYPDPQNAAAARVVLITSAVGGRRAADLTLRLSNIEVNPSLGDRVFEEDVPRDASPISLEELRRAGPLGDQSTQSGDDQFPARRESRETAAFAADSVHHRDTATQRRTEEGFGRALFASVVQPGRAGATWLSPVRARGRRTTGLSPSRPHQRVTATWLRASPRLRASVLECSRALQDRRARSEFS